MELVVPLFCSWLYPNQLCGYEFATFQDLVFYTSVKRES